MDEYSYFAKYRKKAIELNKTAFMCFVDLKQAFDRVRLKNVLQLFRARGISTRIIAAIKDLNMDNTTIRTDNVATKRIPMASGMRQGDSLSSILFNLSPIMDEIIKEVKKSGRGFRMETRNKNAMPTTRLLYRKMKLTCKECYVNSKQPQKSSI